MIVGRRAVYIRQLELEIINLKRQVRDMSTRSDALIAAAAAAEKKISDQSNIISSQADQIKTLTAQIGEAAEDQAAMDKVTPELNAAAQ